MAPADQNIIMGYEDSVYLAKLAEQAERYEGQYRRVQKHPQTDISSRNGREHEDRRVREPRTFS